MARNLAHLSAAALLAAGHISGPVYIDEMHSTNEDTFHGPSEFVRRDRPARGHARINPRPDYYAPRPPAPPTRRQLRRNRHR